MLCHDLSKTHPYLIELTPYVNMSNKYGVELHPVITTETAFIRFHYVYLYLTFVYNLSARRSEQYILPRQKQLPNTTDFYPA